MKIRLGSDLIECLSWSLYENPIVLFREAIQNSIDAFQTEDTEWEKLIISITLDTNKREINISDNGPGLSADNFIASLNSLGESKKKNHNYAGCRGIGRLSGLGVCDSITFTSKQSGSDVESKCIIDAKGIKDGLRNENNNKDISDFLSKYVAFSIAKTDAINQHYFNVKYSSVKRISCDQLLSPSAVEQYLSSIAPVPLAQSIPEITNVEQLYKKYKLPYGICIKVNDNLSIKRKLTDNKLIETNKCYQYEEHEIVSKNDEILGVAWFIHHDYLGSLGPSPFRGLRFRHKNILIGNEDTYANLFKEPRFNRWTIGEVNALSTGIRPSVKRDDFEPNELFNELTYKLRPLLFKVGQLARKSSAKRIEIKNTNNSKQLSPQVLKIRREVAKKIGTTISRKRLIKFMESILINFNGKIKAVTLLEMLLK